MSSPSLNLLVRRLLALTSEERAAALAKLQRNNPEGYTKLTQYFKAHPGAADEALGYNHWLRKLGAHTFTRPFAPIHKEFWSWNWETLIKIQDGILLDPRDLIAFIPWAREYGKSSTVEWAAIAEGALLKGGYVIYVSGRQSQAEEHVVAIRDRIESERVADTYPWLGKPKMGAHNNRFGWGREFLMTAGGWAIRPVGLDVAIRGGKTLNMRPTLIILDDIDELGDSPYVVEGKERTLTRSILPMGTDKTRVLVAQNPIHANSMVNRMLTGVSLALSVRKVFGPVPAMSNFAYEIRQTDDGPVPIITQGETTWPEVTKEMWQATLQRVGPESFMSEYQHDMSVAQEERVLPEYDDRNLRLHLVTWSQFEAKYGMRRIPSDWGCDAGLDIGYTAGHKSAWTFTAKVPQRCELAGSIFRYRGRTFTGIGIDEQSTIIRSEMWPHETLQRQFMSHEKLGERLVLAQKHGWHFLPCDSAKTAGIAQWRHFLRPDRNQPHPFHRDEKGVDGKWKLGRPAWFDIVADDQFFNPTDDAGLKRHRDGAFNWRQVPVKLTDKGFSIEQPAKMDDDECLVAGTLITTRYGDIPIEKINPLTDVVWTRLGWNRVRAAVQTKSKAEIWSVTLSNGLQLKGTKRHPVWVQGYGWKPLSALKEGEKLLSIGECGSIVTQTQSIGRTEHILSRMFTRLEKDSRRYISNSGKRLTGRCQKAVQFTISTTIPLTTTFPTSHHLAVPSIVPITVVPIRPNFSLGSGRIWNICKSALRTGIAASRVERGIESMRRRAALGWLRRSLRSVTSALTNSGRDRSGEGSVPTPVSNAFTITVTSVKREAASPVYNLQVENCPEYFANGVLVHNCDSTRMLTAGFGPLEKPMTPAQKLDALIPAGYHARELAKSQLSPNEAAMTADLAYILASKAMKASKPQRTDEFGQVIAG